MATVFGPLPLHQKSSDRDSEAEAVCDEICAVRVVDLLRDQRAQLDSEGNDEEQPVKEGHAVCITDTGVLEPLDREDDAEREDRDGCCPHAEVAKPYLRVVDNLYYKLGGKIGDDEGKQRL